LCELVCINVVMTKKVDHELLAALPLFAVSDGAAVGRCAVLDRSGACLPTIALENGRICARFYSDDAEEWHRRSCDQLPKLQIMLVAGPRNQFSPVITRSRAALEG
jgi:hypothetical protein